MAENHILLETIQLTQSAASVTFDNIPQTGYTDLKIVTSSRNSVADTENTIAFNGVTTGFTVKRIWSNGSTTGSDSLYGFGGLSVASTYTANTFSSNEIYIPNYSVSGIAKSFSVDAATENNATGSVLTLSAPSWSGTAAITSITITPLSGSYVAGSTFSIYGVAALGTTPAIAPLATGGNIVANDGTYWYHAFLSSGTFTPFKDLSCDYLVIAGGGAGGSANTSQHGGGGGGAGGYLSSVGSSGGGASAGSVLSLTAQSYAVSVGAGGTSNANGTNTTFADITATGGGRGAIGATQNGFTGGSGGGGSSSSSPGAGGSATASPVQGFAGGAGQGTNNYRTGAGGGAGALGGNGDGNGNGTLESVGGAGKNTLSAWASATNTGVSGYFAGGGGGGSGQFANPSNVTSDPNTSNGGAGGGGRGAFTGGSNVVATSGVANTGSGGGGSHETGAFTNSGVGGNGGSGIVIVRYPMV
jgi:hypothetical protein